MRKLLNKSLLNNIKFKQSYLLKNARIVNADFSEQGDVLIEHGKIAQISRNISHKNAEVIDCTNKLLIPGGIDTHTHMQLPFMGTQAVDDFDTGSKAAIAGGTTSFIDFAIPSPQQTMSVAYQRWRGWADPKVNCDYALHAAITSWNSQTPNEMKRMVENGITSFKFFMAYKGFLGLDDVAIFKAFETARDLGALCIVHAENGDIIALNQKRLLEKGMTGPQGHYFSRPQSVEAQAVHRVITIAEHANVPVYIVHLMSKQASEQVLRAKNRGLLVHGQTLAASIGTDGTKLFDKDWDIASKYVMSPCLNPDPKVKIQLMKYLSSGVIDVIGTDNCTFCTEKKRFGINDFTKIPNGVNGLQDRLSLVWTKGVRTGLLSQNQFVQKTSSKAAQIFNMYPRKGIIRVGSDADVVVWDPNHKKTILAANHHHKVDFNIFEGQQVYGKADFTFSNGNLVWNGKNFLNQQKGQYIKRQPFGYVYSRHQAWTKTNDPLNFKVNRTKKDQKTTSLPNSTEQLKINQLENELKKLRQQRDQLLSKVQKQQQDVATNYQGKNLINSYQSLKKYLPDQVFESVRHIFYGNKTDQVPLKNQTKKIAEKKNIEVKSFKIGSLDEELRSKRLVKVAAIQHSIVLPTTEPVKKQKWAILERVKEIIELAALEGANIVCLQQIFNAPFFMCTRERYPWVQFSESLEGETVQFMKELAKKHNMIIIPSILEREKNKQTLHNSSVYIDNHGDVLGKQQKGHIPRVGDFNESTYYMQGESGHPVYETEFGRIGSNICFGRHHPLHWMGFGLNGAEIVVNPAATINGLSEPLWAIQGRNAAVANHYFTVNINRVGTEIYPHVYTSGDKKGPKKEFGHFYGSSYVAAPDGSRTPGLSRVSDGLLITQIDLNMGRQIKDIWGFAMTGRHKIYAELLTKYSTFDFEPQIVKKGNKK